MTYRIRAKSVDGSALKFTKVEEYHIFDGMIHFKDSMTGVKKMFAVINVQIEEEGCEDE